MLLIRVEISNLRPFLHIRFITGSYDQTCRVWDTKSGENLVTLKGHKNVVYALSFNLPYGYVF